MIDLPLAFVDIETTGSHFDRDKITEVAILTLSSEGLMGYERLINPQCPIPSFIQTLTGITPEMVMEQAPFEEEAKKIIAHIGLPWDDACLKFYETDRQVKTASLNQVRKPIYSTSIGRWKKYEDHLKPLIQELGPLIKVYDDKVKQKLDTIKSK